MRAAVEPIRWRGDRLELIDQRLLPDQTVYVAAPLSTFDLKTGKGKDIPIEERPAEEVTGYRGTRWAPQGIGVRNPAFDVTPASLISALVTERGVAQPVDTASVAALLR